MGEFLNPCLWQWKNEDDEEFIRCQILVSATIASSTRFKARQMRCFFLVLRGWHRKVAWTPLLMILVS